MKALNTLIKNHTAYFLILLMLIQSCVAYQTTPTTLNTAVNNGPVKLIDNEGRVYKFKNVDSKDGAYFGTGGVYSNLKFVMTPDGAISTLDSANFSMVYLKDVKKSKTQSVWMGIVIAAPVIFIIVIAIALLSYY